MSLSSITTVKTVSADGIEIFYREAGSLTAPTFLLLHGFPSSSFQYRNLITKLATKYRVIAPDLPGFGFTVIPESRQYEYTFDNLTKTIEAFTDALSLEKYAIYIFDYGAPTGLRLAMRRPESITAIVSQNGNAFVEGLGDFWNTVKVAWANPSEANLKPLEALTTFDTTKYQYVTGEAEPQSIPPETYHLDFALLSRPGNSQIQLNLILDYKNNVALYPAFHSYFRTYQPPVLAIWGKNDPFFIPPGAIAFKENKEAGLKDVEVDFVDGGHFALERHLEEIVEKIVGFMEKRGL